MSSTFTILDWVGLSAGAGSVEQQGLADRRNFQRVIGEVLALPRFAQELGRFGQILVGQLCLGLGPDQRSSPPSIAMQLLGKRVAAIYVKRSGPHGCGYRKTHVPVFQALH